MAAEEDELLFGDDGSTSTKQDDEFDCIVQELQMILMDDEFSARQEAFFATHCGSFVCTTSWQFTALHTASPLAPPSPPHTLSLSRTAETFEDEEENKLEYMSIFTEYKETLERELDTRLTAVLPDYSFERFAKLLDDESRAEEIGEELIEMIGSMTDFGEFKATMLAYKRGVEAKLDDVLVSHGMLGDGGLAAGLGGLSLSGGGGGSGGAAGEGGLAIGGAAAGGSSSSDASAR